MRLGFVAPRQLSERSGGYLYDRELVSALRRLGVSVEVMEPTVGARVLRRAPFDALLQDELAYRQLLGVNRALVQDVRYPVVALVHNPQCFGPMMPWRRAAAAWREADYLRGVHKIIANSDHTRRQVEQLSQTHKPTLVAGPAADHLGETVPVTPDEIDARSGGPLRLLCVAHLTPIKGIRLMLDGLARVTTTDWSLQIAGGLERDPSYVLRVRQHIQDLGMCGRVDLLGELSAAELRAAYRASHTLILTSPREGFGLAYLEAMSYGLPVIASGLGAAPELVTNDVNGRLINVHRPEEVAGAVESVSERRADMGKAALAAARAWPHQRWEDVAHKVIEFL